MISAGSEMKKENILTAEHLNGATLRAGFFRGFMRKFLELWTDVWCQFFLGWRFLYIMTVAASSTTCGEVITKKYSHCSRPAGGRAQRHAPLADFFIEVMEKVHKQKIRRGKWTESVNSFEKFWTEELKKRTDLSIPDKNVFTALCAMSYSIGPTWFKPYVKSECGITLSSLMATYTKGMTTGKVTESMHHLADAGLIDFPPYGKKEENGKTVIIPATVRVKESGLVEEITQDSSRCLLDILLNAKGQKEDELKSTKTESYRTFSEEQRMHKPKQQTHSSQDEDKRNRWIEDTREQLIMNATESELNVKEMLDFEKVEYTFQKPFVTADENIYFVDFYLPHLKVGIEVDGGYHTTKEQRRKDLERTMELEDDFGVRIYRLDNCDTTDCKLLKHCLDDIMYRRKNELGTRKTGDIVEYLKANLHNEKVMGDLMFWTIDNGWYSTEFELQCAINTTKTRCGNFAAYEPLLLEYFRRHQRIANAQKNAKSLEGTLKTTN